MTIAETVALLDYSKPPSGYEAEQDAGDSEVGAWGGAWGTYLRSGGETVWESAWLMERDDALSAAWVHYKAHNDPPGIETVPTMGQGAAFVMPGSPFWAKRGAAIVLPWVGKFPSARAAAWAWHDRRHALAERGLAYRGRGWAAPAVWPRCLTWTDEQVAEVERWLRDSTAEMPEVLRG